MKEIRVVFNEKQMQDLEKAKLYFNETTKKKTLVRILETFIRINNL